MTDETEPTEEAKPGKKRQPWWVWVAVAVIAVIIIANIPKDDDSKAAADATTSAAASEATTDAPPAAVAETPTSEPTPEPEPSVTVDDVLAYLESSTGGHMFKEMCTSVGYDGWQCWYDNLEITASGANLTVNITTDGGRTNAELDEMADQAARWFRNFLSGEFDFKWYIAVVNGVHIEQFQPL